MTGKAEDYLQRVFGLERQKKKGSVMIREVDHLSFCFPALTGPPPPWIWASLSQPRDLAREFAGSVTEPTRVEFHGDDGSRRR